MKVFLREIQFQKFDCNRGQSEFHRLFTRHIRNPFSSLQHSQIPSVKKRQIHKCIDVCVTQNDPLALKWHLHVLETSTYILPHTLKNEKVVSDWIRPESAIKESINPVSYSQILFNT